MDDRDPSIPVELVERVSSPQRFRIRRAVAIFLTLAAIGEAGRRSTPLIRREVGSWLILQAIDAGRFDEAESRLDDWIAESPRNTRPRLTLVQLYRRQARITEAEEALQRAIELGLPVEAARQEHDLIQREIDQPEPIAPKTAEARPRPD